MPVREPRADWFRQAVTSALDEAVCEIELFVVADGEREPVESLLQEIDDPRVRLLVVERGGPYAARNAGLRAANGSHVRFVDSDDVVEPGSTGRLLAVVGERDDVVAYGATLMCDEALEPVQTVTSTLEGDVTDACVVGGFHVYVVSMLFPRRVIERAGEWETTAFRVSGDWDFVLRTLEHAEARRLDETVTRYRRHGGSITRRADVAAGAEAGRLVLERYFARNPELAGSALARRAFVRLYVDRARAHAWQGESRAALVLIGRTARLSPSAAAGTLLAILGQRVRSLTRSVARRAGLRPRKRA
jgi:glycosyltransferase involved in cell wall biosynthesis